MYSKVCGFWGYISYTNSRKYLTTGWEMSHESLQPMKWRHCIGRFMYSIALLASSMAPCTTVFASQLIEKTSLEYNNRSMTHQKDKCAVEQYFVNYDKRGHIFAWLVVSSSAVVPRQGAVILYFIHWLFHSYIEWEIKISWASAVNAIKVIM